jgi:hypothetical protein
VKKKGRDRSAGRPSISDLQMIFLKAIGSEAPEAVQDLFSIWNAEEWARKYRAKAQWLVDFASQALRLNLRIANHPAEFRRNVALTAWNAAIARRRAIVDALDTAALKVGAGFDVERLDKRDPQTHCRLLAMSLFKGMSDQEIADADRYASRVTVAGKRAEIASILEIELQKPRGRPRKM